MARVWDHLSVVELEQRFVNCAEPVEARHTQAIWLLAQGRTVSEVSKLTAFGERWIQQLLERYNADGPDALGNGRRRNGSKPRILVPTVLEKLRARLAEPPPDGGLWSSRKVSAFLAEQLGLEAVAPQRGWEALRAIGWSLQKPRPKNPRSASDEEADAFQKNWRRPSPRKRPSTPASRSRSSPPTSTGSG